MTEGSALGHTTTTGKCTRCGVDFSKWEVSYYVDNFNQPTNEWYITNKYQVTGTFSNSATTDSKLEVIAVIDPAHISFVLYEYGSSQVKNSSSYSYKLYNITILDDSNNQHAMTGTIYLNGDRLAIDDPYYNEFIQILSNSSKIRVFIENQERTINKYLFDLEGGNFKELYTGKMS